MTTTTTATTFGWCESAPGAVPYHGLCHRSYTNQAGMERVCGCSCHNDPTAEHADQED